MMGETALTGLLERDRRECDLENKPCFLSIALEKGEVGERGRRFGGESFEEREREVLR